MVAVTLNQQYVDDAELFKASLFVVALVLIFVTSLTMVLTNTPPIIVGTELNTNGVVEYLCLGNGCENLQDFDW